MGESVKARLVSLLRRRHQPASVQEEPQLAEAVKQARSPHVRAERRPERMGERR
jgi:hypothetical protein